MFSPPSTRILRTHSDQLTDGLIAKLVEHYIEVTGSVRKRFRYSVVIQSEHDV